MLRNGILVLCAGLSMSSAVPAQELDTAIPPTSGQQSRTMEKIESPQERQALLELYGTTDPRRRYELAELFLQTYPTSWMLAAAYEAAAKASIDLGEYGRAIAEARLSLRLFPENSLLLVPLSNAQAKQGLLNDAEQSAQDALEYLDVFAPPSGMQPGVWEQMKAQLEASAYFALARVFATRGLPSQADANLQLQKAYDAATDGLEWKPQDTELLYLRALISEGSGNVHGAAQDLAQLKRSGQTYPQNVDARLRRFYTKEGRGTFEEFLQTLPPPHIAPPPDKTLRPGTHLGYAGSSTCQECHNQEYAAWRQTGMAKMLQAYETKSNIGDFESTPEFHDSSATIRIGRDNGKPVFSLTDRNGKWLKFPVAYTIGSKFQQAYVTRLPDGRLQVIPIQYNAIHHQWVNYWKALDPAGSQRADISRFVELSPATSYRTNCAVCHTSRTRPDAAGDLEVDGSQRELGINCEMCHGPAASHVAGSHGKAPSSHLVNFSKISARDEVNICAQCHRQSVIRSENSHLEWATWEQSHHIPSLGPSQPFPDFSRLASYKDGRFRQTTFIVESFTRTKCFRKGGARCSSCHDPHSSDASHNPVSLKFRDNPDQMCLSCHPKFSTGIQKHTRHAPESAGSRCTACHMPRITESLMFNAMSHQIDDIPDAELTARFGQGDSPNACLLCHAAKSQSWLQSNLALWPKQSTYSGDSTQLLREIKP